MTAAPAPAAGDDVAVAALVLALADEELTLVGDGDPADLAELHARRDAAMAALPSSLSPAARDLIQRALVRQREVDELLTHSMDVRRGQLGLVARGQRLARGYTPVRTRTRSLVDRTA
jgi:hypothetical protein